MLDAQLLETAGRETQSLYDAEDEELGEVLEGGRMKSWWKKRMVKRWWKKMKMTILTVLNSHHFLNNLAIQEKEFRHRSDKRRYVVQKAATNRQRQR